MPSSLLQKAGAGELRHDTPSPGEPPERRPAQPGWRTRTDPPHGSRTGISPPHILSPAPEPSHASAAGAERRKQLLPQPGRAPALPGARRQTMGRPRDAQTPQPPPAPRHPKSGHFAHPTRGVVTFLPIGEGAVGHHVDLLPGKSTEPMAAPTEPAALPEPTASPFLLLSVFLSVLSPLCLL